MQRSLILGIAALLTALGGELALAGGVGPLGLRYERQLVDAPPGTTSGFANCDPGEKLIGGGVAVSGNRSQLELGTSFPDSATSWIGTVNNQSGAEAFMSLHGVCADLGRYQRVSTSTSVPAGTSGFEQKRCPAGTKVTGGGVEASATGSSVELGATIPMDARDPGRVPDDGWEGVLHNETAGAITMTVHAICIENQAFFPSYSVSRVDVPGGQLGSARARCPLSGQSGVSGGGVNSGGINNSLELTDTYPVDFPADANQLPDDGWKGGVNNETGQERTLTVVAICVG